MSAFRTHVHRLDIAMFYEKLAQARAYIAQAEAVLETDERFPPISASVALHMASGCINAAASVADWAAKNSMAGSKRVEYEGTP